MLRKIITYFLMLAVVLPVLSGAVPLPATSGGVNVAHAEDATEEGSSDGKVSNPCEFHVIRDTVIGALAAVIPLTYRNDGGSVWDCASYTIVYIMYEFVMRISIWIAGLASDLFNVSIQFSLTGEIFDADKNTMIKDGWTMVRDLLNLVFIFILLFAAISTILQYGGFEIKKVLPSLIVVALLVNFSMMIAKMVIDASHIFAWEFYNQIDVTDGGKTLNMQNSINVDRDFEKKNLASVFMAGFNPQDLLIGSKMQATTTEDGKEKAIRSPWLKVYEHARSEKNDESIMSTLWRMATIILLESALALFAGFILFAGAIMFVIRVVVLWMVIISSPIAFLGMILPSMKKYSDMWWEYLIGQSFFAPAFLFMFMLATKFINSGFVDNILYVVKDNDSSIVTGLDMGEIVRIFFNFLIVGGIMSLCLVVAKQLGGKTAEFGISWAHKGKDLALGATKFGINNRGTRYLGGKAGDSNWWAQSIGRIPGGNILGRKLGAMKKADEDKARKTAEKYVGTLSSSGRKSLASDIEGKGFMKRFMYTGPEGAFKPGKEGYEKIIAKKKADKYEEERYRKNLATLAGINDDVDSKGVVIKTKEEKVKGMINRGEEEILDEEIKKTTEKFENMFQKGINVLEKTILGIDVDLREKGGELYELVRRSNEKGLSSSEIASLKLNIDKTKAEILRKERIKAGLSGQKTITDIKRKERESVEKSVEKYEAKQETEKLGAKFGSSGAGGGGGKSGGGGKTTP